MRTNFEAVVLCNYNPREIDWNTSTFFRQYMRRNLFHGKTGFSIPSSHLPPPPPRPTPSVNRELKQRRRQRERHKFACLVSKSNSFAQPAHAFLTFCPFLCRRQQDNRELKILRRRRQQQRRKTMISLVKRA